SARAAATPAAARMRPRALHSIRRLYVAVGAGSLGTLADPRRHVVTFRRGVGLVLGLIGLAVLLSFTLLALLYMGVSRRSTVPRAATLVLRPGGDLPELPPDTVVG